MALKPIQKFIIISAVSLVVIFSIYKIAFPTVKKRKSCDPEVEDCSDVDPLLIIDPDEYVDETFPLAKGMMGDKIVAVRTFLGLTPSKYFDVVLEDELYKKFKVKTITESDYNWWKSRMPTWNV